MATSRTEGSFPTSIASGCRGWPRAARALPYSRPMSQAETNARASQPAGEGIGNDGVVQRIGLARRRLVIDGDACHIRFLVGVGVKNAAEQQHLPLGAGRVHLGL